VSASYSRGLIAHASIATSCALARFDGRLLEVWSHTQGIFPLRAAIADALGLDKPDVVVYHVEGRAVTATIRRRRRLRRRAPRLRTAAAGPGAVDRAAEFGSGPLASAMTADGQPCST